MSKSNNKPIGCGYCVHEDKCPLKEQKEKLRQDGITTREIAEKCACFEVIHCTINGIDYSKEQFRKFSKEYESDQNF